MSRTLDRMEAAGLIARARDAKDRRFVTTRITGDGPRLLDPSAESVMELHRRQFTALGEKDLRQLVRTLELVRGSA